MWPTHHQKKCVCGGASPTIASVSGEFLVGRKKFVFRFFGGYSEGKQEQQKTGCGKEEREIESAVWIILEDRGEAKQVDSYEIPIHTLVQRRVQEYFFDCFYRTPDRSIIDERSYIEEWRSNPKLHAEQVYKVVICSSKTNRALILPVPSLYFSTAE